ncbi:putative Rap1a domain-containing protein [Gammaproteobacteria bacterium]
MRDTFIPSFILTFFLITTVAAQPMQGQELYNYLEEYLKVQNGYEGNSIKAGMFLGYIRGILDALDGTALCIPNNIPLERILQQVITGINDHHQSQRNVARNLVLEALRSQFACR